MNIEDISIFGTYKQPENRLTAAFLQICKVGGEDLIRFLSSKLKINLPSSDISIISQIKKSESGSVPDGLLQSNFAFNLYVESKIKNNDINLKQLVNHKKLLIHNNDFLLYLTPDEIKPSELDGVYWANWGQIRDTFNEYLKSASNDNIELLDFLVKNFVILLDNLNLSKATWKKVEKDSVLIVAGNWAENVARNYDFYLCQNNRSFKPSEYITFYNSNELRYLYKIKGEPKDDTVLSGHERFKKYLELNEPNYESDDMRKYFELEFVCEFGPVVNDSIDKNGKPCPYTYGQPRYTTREKLVGSKKTSEL